MAKARKVPSTPRALPPTPTPEQRANWTWPADKIEYRSLAVLLTYARNARLHSEDQVNQIAASITEFGWTNPVIIDEENVIIAGHGRVLAGAKLGINDVPCVVARGWTEAQKKAYRLADNQLPANATWDQEMLRLELGDLARLDFDLKLLGFDDLQLVQFMAQRRDVDPEAAPEPPEIPVSRTGDIWLMGNHRLLCGDATSAEDVARVLAGAKPHLMVTDPPYGVNYDPSWRDRELQTWTRPTALGLVQGDDTADWSAAWKLFGGDVAYTWHPAGARSVEHHRALMESGFDVRMQIIWAKPHFPIGRGNYHVQHEPCWYAVRKGKTAHWQGDRTQSTLWQIDNASAFKGSRSKGDEQTGHGTQKPVECMKRPIENNSRPGESVYDPFVGSGTTIIAGEITQRRIYALDLDAGYVDVAVRRWEKFAGRQATLAATGETFEAVAAQREGEHDAQGGGRDPVPVGDAGRDGAEPAISAGRDAGLPQPR